MKMSKLFVQTLREYPSDAEVISHKMLGRAGFIKKLAPGIYTYMPLMWRVLKKIENIVREEMDRAGAQELLMPFVQPKELWEESGRWEVYGKELMRLKDRHERDMCLGPTHEEIITSVARDALKSYKQLPVNLYQIQSKFRDEIRPRYGLLRGREFIMKDAYSFDLDESGLDKEYQNMAQAYKKIFERCGLDTKMVQSDSGAIGGSVSHEFMVITDTDAGENDVFYCNSCDYSANSNHAISNLPEALTDGKDYFKEKKVIDTPDTHSIEELSKFLNIPDTLILKTLVYIVDKKPVLALIRADKGFDAVPGFIGPKGMNEIQIIADETVRDLKNFVVGINQTDKHMVGANLSDLEIENLKFADIRLVQRGELCPQCGKPLYVTKGIEVGNIFKLGTKYSKPMNAVYTDIEGKTHPYVMGCYGIGISRTAAAAVEAHYDEHGIKWPIAIAPYQVVIVPVNINDQIQMKVAEKMYNELSEAGIEVVLDDRDERAGVKFKDADLIGFPFRVTVGKTINEGFVEYKVRETGEQEKYTPDEATQKLIDIIKAVK